MQKGAYKKNTTTREKKKGEERWLIRIGRQVGHSPFDANRNERGD